jgi:Methyltransferase domain
VNGARRIFLYNWPMFVGTWCLAVLLAALGVHYGRGLLVLMAGASLGWSVVALAVSSYIYDWSPLARGTWLTSLGHGTIHAWAAIDAGLDAEVDLEPHVPGTCLARLELSDPTTMRGASIRRAKSLTPRSHGAILCTPDCLPLPDASCDAVFVPFAAHEIQTRAARAQFFSEVSRVLRPRASLVLVEHLRDVWNFAAFGPGAFHFFPRGEWLFLAAHAGFDLRNTRRITPWVTALVLERSR